MKKMTILICSILFTFSITAQEFLRKLPERSFVDALSSEKLKNKDAVIILKEQSYKIENQEVSYRGEDYEGPSSTYTKIIIVKLLTEIAVQRYGTFEYEYPERFGNEIPNGFEVRVRILKPNDEVYVMPKGEAKTIVSSEEADGTPLSRKVIFKVPNLSVGDVLQIEYSSGDVFTRSLSRVFYYSDVDLTLYSNLYITLPSDDEVKYLSFPQNIVGNPQISQVSQSFGSGSTYFWGVKNVAAVPIEPFSIPFADQSLITAFIVQRYNRTFIGDWDGLAKNFYKNYLDEDKVSSKQINLLGFSEKQFNVGFELVDSLYAAIRKKFELRESNSLFPLSKNVGKLFDRTKGDASDLSYIMYRILGSWNVESQIFWIRDKREGLFESTVPTTVWFDRMGVSVKINGVERFYDFDKSIPVKYETPWFLKGISIVSIGKENGTIRQIPDGSIPASNSFNEIHNLSFTKDLKIIDDLKMKFMGFGASAYRRSFYSLEKKEIEKQITDIAKNTILKEVDSLIYNDFANEESFSFEAIGEAKSAIENVDNFISFKLKNDLLSRYKSRIFTTARKGHIKFNGPFEYNFEWTINNPEGYLLKSLQSDRIFSGVANSSSLLSFIADSKSLKIKLTMKFSDSIIPVQNYSVLTALLDNVTNEIEKDIVFEKKPEEVKKEEVSKPVIAKPKKKQ